VKNFLRKIKSKFYYKKQIVCPICRGEKIIWSPFIRQGVGKVCTTCNGGGTIIIEKIDSWFILFFLLSLCVFSLPFIFSVF